MATINLASGNRAVGLLNEVADMIATEDNSLELARITATLRSLMAEARRRTGEVEKQTRDIAQATHSQKAKRQSASARILAITARL